MRGNPFRVFGKPKATPPFLFWHKPKTLGRQDVCPVPVVCFHYILSIQGLWRNLVHQKVFFLLARFHPLSVAFASQNESDELNGKKSKIKQDELGKFPNQPTKKDNMICF